MKRKSLKFNLITAGLLLTYMFSNPAASCVYATELTPVTQSADTTATADTKGDIPVISEEEIDSYFNGSVFVGDSIMLGFRNYCMKYSKNEPDSFLHDIQFLAAGSYSVTNSLWDVTEKSVHPVYKGEKRQVWESISMMDANKVFLFFGMNDLNISGLEGTCELYKQLVSNIKEKKPDVEIHIISMTYTLKDAGKGKLKNDTIREFNVLLQDMALENGWGYLDLATPLSDENGDLPALYCSDGYVHQSKAAYDVWATVIRDYARTQLDGTTQYPASLPVTDELSAGKPSVSENAAVISSTLGVPAAGTATTVITEEPAPLADSVRKTAKDEIAKEYRLTAGFSAQ